MHKKRLDYENERSRVSATECIDTIVQYREPPLLFPFYVYIYSIRLEKEEEVDLETETALERLVKAGFNYTLYTCGLYKEFMLFPSTSGRLFMCQISSSSFF